MKNKVKRNPRKITYKSIEKEQRFFVYEKPPLVRLWSHRVRKFLFELVKHIDENAIPTSIRYDVIKATVECVLDTMSAKNRLKVYLSDISLACFWLKLQEYGITGVSIVKLIRVAKRVLNYRITQGKILRVVSFIKDRSLLRNINSIDEVRKNVIMILDRMFSDRAFVEKKFGINISASVNMIDLKLKIIEEITKCLSSIPSEFLIGPPRKVLAATLLYVFFRKYNRGAFHVSSSDLERYSGVCKFTILRKYKKIEKCLNKCG